MNMRLKKKLKPSDIEYLAFQGGGGKGLAYIGAIQGLETLGILPNPNTKIGGNIKGVSGASAGAITAFLVALQCSSIDIKRIFSKEFDPSSFFDDPNNGYARGVSVKEPNFRYKIENIEKNTLIPNSIEILLKIKPLLEVFKFGNYASSIPISMIALFLGIGNYYIDEEKNELIRKYPFMSKIFNKPAEYSYNLLNDRGVFPGFGIREFLINISRKYIKRLPKWKNSKKDPASINFSDFFDLTGIDLVIVGTNLSQRRSFLFSAQNTPKFPVIEAVGISATFPIVFKPVWIKKDISNPIFKNLDGYWVDGGILNNLPIKAFNRLNDNSILNPSTLALQLIEGAPRSHPISFPEDRPGAALANFAFDLYESVFSNTGQGNIISEEEKNQTVKIFSYSLSILDFSPDENSISLPIKNAKREVISHFS